MVGSVTCVHGDQPHDGVVMKPSTSLGSDEEGHNIQRECDQTCLRFRVRHRHFQGYYLTLEAYFSENVAFTGQLSYPDTLGKIRPPTPFREDVTTRIASYSNK